LLSVLCAAASRLPAVFVPVFVLAFAALTSLTAPCLVSAAETQVEAIVAQVGNEVILLSEVMELAAPVEERMRQAGAPRIEIVRVRKDALERLIETRLVSSVVERLELGADPDEVDAAISAIASDNGISVEQLLRSIVSHGLRVEEYRAKIQDEIERSKVINTMVRSRVQITDEEVEALYAERFGEQYTGGEEFHLRHIIVSPEGPHADSHDAACQLVRVERRRIQSGEVAFSEVATNVSDMNSDRGGDLGWMHRKDLATWMADSIDELDSGELSEVIQMPFGCNLLQLVDRRAFERIELDDAKAQLQNIVFQRKTEVEYTKWLDELREHTYIERKSGFGG
jgi:peptidyl-prolyl cis-trans isomerase SurA